MLDSLHRPLSRVRRKANASLAFLLGLLCLARLGQAQSWQLAKETFKDPEYGHTTVIPVLQAEGMVVRYHQPAGWRVNLDTANRKLTLTSTNGVEFITLSKVAAPAKEFEHDTVVPWILRQHPQASAAEDLNAAVQGKPAFGCSLTLPGGIEVKTLCLEDKTDWWVMSSRRPIPKEGKPSAAWNLFVRNLSIRERTSPNR